MSLMRPKHLVEGIDYIFDRYAYLGLERTASAAEITTAIRTRRAENHPDRMLHVGSEVVQIAARVRTHIDNCAAVLLVPELRTAYDAQLAEFTETSPALVSQDGTPILDPSRYRIDIDGLVGAAVETGSEAGDVLDMEAQARTLSGYDAGRTDLLARLFADHPDDLSLFQALKDDLARKLVYTGILEDLRWNAAGILGKRVRSSQVLTDPDEYVASITAEISRVADTDLRVATEARSGMAQIGLATPPLLLSGPDGSVSGASVPTLDIEQLHEQARTVFLQRSAQIVDVAETKAEVLKTLLKMSELEYGGDGGPEMRIYIAIRRTHLPEGREPEVYIMAGCALTREGHLSMAEEFTPGLYADWVAPPGSQTVMIIHNMDIEDYTLELGYAAEKLLERNKVLYPPLDD